MEALILQTIVDGIEDCGLDAPARVVRYHGQLPNLPCCDAGDKLSISWESAPAPQPCGGPQSWLLLIRWVTCWPVPEPSPNTALNIDWTAVEEASTRIADYSECIQAVLNAEVCQYGPMRPEWFNAMGKPTLDRVEPIPPNGGCAGARWRIVVPIKRPASPPT